LDDLKAELVNPKNQKRKAMMQGKPKAKIQQP